MDWKSHFSNIWCEDIDLHLLQKIDHSLSVYRVEHAREFLLVLNIPILLSTPLISLIKNFFKEKNIVISSVSTLLLNSEVSIEKLSEFYLEFNKVKLIEEKVLKSLYYFYTQLIIFKCIEQNFSIFRKDDKTLCFYEQGEMHEIEDIDHTIEDLDVDCIIQFLKSNFFSKKSN